MKQLIALLGASLLLFSAEAMARPSKLPEPTAAERAEIAQLVRNLANVTRTMGPGMGGGRGMGRGMGGRGMGGRGTGAGSPGAGETIDKLIAYGAKVDFAVPDLARHLAGRSEGTVEASVKILVSTAQAGSANAFNALAKSLSSLKAEMSLVAVLGGPRGARRQG